MAKIEQAPTYYTYEEPELRDEQTKAYDLVIGGSEWAEAMEAENFQDLMDEIQKLKALHYVLLWCAEQKVDCFDNVALQALYNLVWDLWEEASHERQEHSHSNQAGLDENGNTNLSTVYPIPTRAEYELILDLLDSIQLKLFNPPYSEPGEDGEDHEPRFLRFEERLPWMVMEYDWYNEALGTVVFSQERLIFTIAQRKIPTFHELSTDEQEDIIQKGRIGAMRGILRYDIKTDYALSTYIAYWINVAITRLSQAEKQIYQPYAPNQRPLAWDDLEDFIPDDGDNQVEHHIEQQDAAEQVRELLQYALEKGALTQKEHLVVSKVFGLIPLANPAEQPNYASVSRELGITPKRVRDIVNFALAKLNERYSPYLSELLESFAGSHGDVR